MKFHLFKKILAVALLGLTLALLCACSVVMQPTGDNTDRPVAITVEGKTEIPLGGFRYEDFVISATTFDGNTKKYALTKGTISEEDLAKLDTVGVHTLAVTYKNMYTTLTLRVYDPTFYETRFDSKSFVYDGREKSIAVSGAPAGAVISYDAPTAYTDAGVYTVNATVEAEGYDPLHLSATLTIEKAVYDMSGVVFKDKTVIYDGQPHSILAENLPEGVSATYTGNGVTDVGSYVVEVTYTGADTKNYREIRGFAATLIIERGTYDMSDVVFEDKTVSYDGQPHSILAENLPEGVSVSYSIGEVTNVGTYEVTATFSGDAENYRPIDTMHATLTIVKGTYDMSGVVFADKTVTYDGTAHSILAENVPEGVSVSYSLADVTKAGVYTVVATFSGNTDSYNEIDEMRATLTIEKARYDLSALTFLNTTATYDGTVHSITASGLPEGLSASFTNNEHTDAGIYTVAVSFVGDFENYHAVDAKTLTLTIQKATYDMSHVVFADKSVFHDGLSHSILAENLPEGVSVFYTENAFTEIGVYTITASFTGDADNYESIPDRTATLTIKEVTYGCYIVFDDLTVTYDGEAHTITATNLPEGVEVSYTGGSYTEVGEYTITANFLHDTTENGQIPPRTATLKIVKADYDLSAIAFSDKTVTYTGEKHSLAITGTLPEGVSVSYTGNENTDAGTYTVTARFSHTNANYNEIPDRTATLTIVKGTYDMSGVVFADKTVTYDGTAHSLAVTGTLPEGVSVTYTGNGRTDAGTYTVTAHFTGDAQNYNAISDVTATLTIEKGSYDMSGVVFADKTVTYDGTAHSLAVTGTLPEGVSVTYTGNGRTDADTYTVTAHFTGDSANYNAIPDVTATLKVNKATYDMSSVTLPDKTVTYNGKTHSILLTGSYPSGISVTYTGNGKTDAGTYTVTAHFTGDSKNYHTIPDKTATLTINKAVFNTAGIFESLTVTYNGKTHSVYVTSAPDGVSVTYTGNGKTDAGTYTVTASFSNTNENYEPIADMTATITIKKATYNMTGVFTDKTVIFDGKAHSILAENLPTGVSATYTGNGKTAVGEYTVVASFTGDSKNYNTIPDMTAKLIILAGGTYTISYDMGNLYSGDKITSLPENMPTSYTTGIGLSSIPSPVTPHTFLGWYLDATYASPVTTIPELTSGDITLYAKWGGFVIADLDFTGTTATNGGAITDDTGYNLNLGGKDGWRFESVTDGDNTYVIMSTAEDNANDGGYRLGATLNTLLSRYTDTYEISYAVSLARVVDEETGEFLPGMGISYRFGCKTLSGSNDVTVLSISSDGVVTFNGQVVGTLTEELQTFRFVVDLQAHVAGYYDEDGNCLYTMHNEIFDVAYFGTSHFDRNCLNAYIGAASGRAIAFDNVYVALGNSFERGTSHKINYVLPEGTELPANADTSYIEGGIGAGLPIIVPTENYIVRWYDDPEFTGEPIEVIPAGSVGDLTYYGRTEYALLTLDFVVDGEALASYDVAENTTVESNGITLPTVTEKDGYTFVWLGDTTERITDHTSFYGIYVEGDEEKANTLLAAYNAGNFTFSTSITGSDNNGNIMNTASGVLYLATEIRKYVTENADGTEQITNEGYILPLREKLVERLEYMMTKGSAPYFELSPTWSYALVSAAVALAHETDYVWGELSPEVQEKYDFMMECLAYILTLGTDDNNAYETGPGLMGNYHKSWNPNYRLANVLPMIYIGQYFDGAAYDEERFGALDLTSYGTFDQTNYQNGDAMTGADHVDCLLLTFDYETTLEKMLEYGFSRAYNQWTRFNTEDTRLDTVYNDSGSIMYESDGVTQLKSQLPSEFMENGGYAHLQERNDSTGDRLGYYAGKYAGKGVGVRTTYTYFGFRISDAAGIFNQLLAHNYSMDSAAASGGYSTVVSTVNVNWNANASFEAMKKSYTEEKTLAAGTVLLAGTTFGGAVTVNGVGYAADDSLSETVVLTDTTTFPAGSTLYYGYTLQMDTTFAQGTLIKAGTVFGADVTIDGVTYTGGAPTTADITMAASAVIPTGTVLASGTKLGAKTAGVSYIFDGEASPYEGMSGQMRELALKNRASGGYCTHDFVLVVSSLAALESLGLYDLREHTASEVRYSDGTTYVAKANFLSHVWVGTQDYLYKLSVGWTSYATSGNKITSSTTSGSVQFVVWKYYWIESFVDATGGTASGKYDITDFS